MKRTVAEYAELSQLLDEALDLAPADRAAWLEALTGSRAALRPTLEQLLNGNAGRDPLDLARHVESIVQTSALGAETATLAAGGRIDSYELIRELGRGGMGAVWLARRMEGLTRRQVALKLPHPGLFNAELSERIARERDILEGLAHPNIARLYDAGVSHSGQPYLALEYVEGVAINAYCDTRRLGVRERIALFQQVLQAVQFAHSHLIIHRDLKPANILVTDQGKVVLLDFGIAKLLTSGATAETALTRVSGRALTLDYASPEQISGQPLTTASDVYSLGVILYELLCGERPYRLKRDSVAALEQAILDADIRKPSEVSAGDEAAQRRGSTPARLARQLRGDLDTILLKTLRTAPGERYATADALDADLSRHLSGGAVQARRESLWYRAQRFVVRYRAAVAAVSLVIVALATGLSVALWQARVARDEAQRAEAVQDFLISIFQSSTRNQANPVKARNKTARELLTEGSAQLARNTSLPTAERLKMLKTIGMLYNELDLYDDAASLADQRIALLRPLGDDSGVELAEALTSKGANLIQAGHVEAALPALREAESLLTRNHSLDSWVAGYLFSYLAQALNYSDGDQAVAYAERAVKILGRELPESEANLGALWMLADSKRSRDPAAAEEAMHAAMQIAKTMYGDTAPLYGDSAMLLADIQAEELKNELADRNFNIAVGVASLVTGEDDHLVMQSDLRYGKFLLDTGKVDAGQSRIERALARSITKHGADDRVYTAWAHEYATLAWWRRGQLKPALDQARRSFAIYKSGAHDDATAKSAELNFDLLLLERDIGAARAALQLASAIRDKTGTAREPGFKSGLTLREGHLALQEGDATRAEALYREVRAASMPPNLRFRRYHLDAGIGIARAQLLRGDVEAAKQTVDSVLKEVDSLGTSAVFAEQRAQALMTRGRAFAHGDCAKARADWAAAGDQMRLFEDANGYRGRELAQLRRQCP
jgi:serine/threonine-protein kinase